jgi:DNA polymerase-3 subunit delta'
MALANVLDQQFPKGILSGALKKDMLASTYLFHGEAGTGKWALALELAKAINCEENGKDAKALGLETCDLCPSCRKIDKLIHPDVKMIFPLPSVKTQEETERFRREKIKDPYAIVKFERSVNIPVDQVRQMQRGLSLRPFEGKRKVVIITQVENMHPASANSLLKTLEEPPPDSNLILTTTDMNRLLPTVVSRCQQIRFSKIPSGLIERRLKEKYQIPQSKASFYARISNGSLGRALDFIQGEKEDVRQDALALLKTSVEGNTSEIIQKMDQLQKEWDRNSILEMFEFLIALFRDMYLTLEISGKEQMVNYDIASEVVKLSEKFKRQNKVEGAVELIDRIRSDCKTKNVNLKLALLTLGFELRNLTRSQPIQSDVRPGLISGNI